MKKVLSVLLAVAMLAALVVPAFAIKNSTVEATRAEVASIEFGVWANAVDGVITVEEGAEVDLPLLLAGYNAANTAVRFAPECTFALVANTDKVTVNANGYMVAAKATAEGEVAEIMATYFDNKEITFVIKVKVVAKGTTTTTPTTTVINATGYTAGGFDWTAVVDEAAGEKEATLTATNFFTADKVKFVETADVDQVAFLADLDNFSATGWVNKFVNGELVKVSLWYAINGFANYADDVVNNRTLLNKQEVVSMADLLAYLGADDFTYAVDETGAKDVFKYTFNFAEPAEVSLVGESVTFTLVADDFPVVKANGLAGTGRVPAIDGSYKVVAASKTEGTATVPQSSILVPTAVTVEVGKFVDVNAVFNKITSVDWSESYFENAASNPDYSVVWSVADTNDDGLADAAKVMGVRVGKNVVVVEGAPSANAASLNNKGNIEVKTIVNVVPRVVDVVEDAESDVPQTGAALLANLF